MRYAIAGLAVACVVAIALGLGRLATSSADNRADWRQQEVQFLKTVLARIQSELEHKPTGSGTESLRREEQEILDNIAAIEKSAARVAPERAVAPPAPTATAEGAPSASSVVQPALTPRMPAAEARALPGADDRAATASDVAAIAGLAELRPGGALRPAAPDLAGLEMSPELHDAIRPPKPGRKTTAAKAAADKTDKPERLGDAGKPDNAEKANRASKTSRAGKTDRAEKPDPAGKTDDAAKPDRTAKAERTEKPAKARPQPASTGSN